MTEPPPLRLIDTTAHTPDDTAKLALTADAQGRDARALSSLDRMALYLIGFALLVAPLIAGVFASTSLSNIPPQDAVSWLQILSVPIVSVVIALALSVTIAREWQRPVAIGPVGGLAGAACVLAVWAGVSLAAHPPLNAARVDTWIMLLAVLITGGLASRLGRDRKALLGLMLLIVAGGSLAGAWGIHEYLDQWKQGNGAHRVFGTFLNPDFLAGYLLLTLPLTLACFASSCERMAKLLLGLALGLQTACLLLTGSRAGVAMLFMVIVGWLLLLLWAGVGQCRGRQLLAGLGVMLLSALLASSPLLIRLTNTGKPQTENGTVAVASVGEAADTQAHSGKFRQVTWNATLHMTRANLLTGTGIGSYETAFPRYAIAAPTAHAHNSFLQWAAETGAPGALCLLVVFASSSAFAVYVLFLNTPRKSRQKQTEVDNSEETQSDLYIADTEVLGESGARKLSENPKTPTINHQDDRLLLTGLLAAIVCSILHSLFDSDWYIVATALTLSAMVGLLIAQARDIAPLATQTPRPLSKGMLAACGMVALLLAWRGGITYLSRFQAAQGMMAIAEFQQQGAQGLPGAQNSLQNAVHSYQQSADIDPFISEPLSKASPLYQMMGEPDKARTALEQAARVAPSGKTYYQLGQYDKRQAIRQATGGANGANNDDPLGLSGVLQGGNTAAFKSALDAFLRAREYDPHNLQTLHALAETYALAGNTAQSAQTYQDMADLESTPVGTVRAMPEATETEFAYAHARLGKWKLEQQQAKEASAQFQQAATLLRTYWHNRGFEIYQLQRAQNPDKAKGLTTLYDRVLTEWQKALQMQGAEGAVARAQVEAEQATFHQEQQQDQKAEEEASQKAASQANSSQGGSTP